ncbi:MAG: hypothetical protein RR307_03580 [Clostridia bacterium]
MKKLKIVLSLFIVCVMLTLCVGCKSFMDYMFKNSSPDKTMVNRVYYYQDSNARVEAIKNSTFAYNDDKTPYSRFLYADLEKMSCVSNSYYGLNLFTSVSSSFSKLTIQNHNATNYFTDYFTVNDSLLKYVFVINANLNSVGNDLKDSDFNNLLITPTSEKLIEGYPYMGFTIDDTEESYHYESGNKEEMKKFLNVWFKYDNDNKTYKNTAISQLNGKTVTTIYFYYLQNTQSNEVLEKEFIDFYNKNAKLQNLFI